MDYGKGLPSLSLRKRLLCLANPACSAEAFCRSGVSRTKNLDIRFYGLSPRTCQGAVRFLGKHC